jgi:MoxR-like ATPase
MFGLETVIRLCLAALYGGGHVLLEGNPGLGKTELVKSLGRVLGLQSNRIQFTPDLMPSDITGTEVLVPGSSQRRFEPGPIFASLVLADEINRAGPKTQSATLEAMAERKVTVLGTTHALPSPFVLFATQNPIEHEGTYSLPAAQADRFMFKVRMPTPNQKTTGEIVDKRSSNWIGTPADADVSSASTSTSMAAIARTVRDVKPLAEVRAHIINLYLATNHRLEELIVPTGTSSEIRTAAGQFEYGISPRAAGDIMLGAKAWLCLTDDEVEDAASAFHLQAVVVDALRHRLKLTFADDLEGDPSKEAIDPESRLEVAIRRLCALTAPKRSGYGKHWEYWHKWTA